MAIHIDRTLPQEEQDRIFHEIWENVRKFNFRITYDKLIEDGTSVEEAIRIAKENETNFAL